MTSTCRLNSCSLLAESLLFQKWRGLAKTNPGAHLDVGEPLGTARVAVHDDAHILHLRASVGQPSGAELLKGVHCCVQSVRDGIQPHGAAASISRQLLPAHGL